MKLGLAGIFLITLAAPASAYMSGEGHEYRLTCNANGYSLKSVNPVGRFIGHGAGTQIKSERETLALGRSCDAHVKAFGYGEWCWANGGFFATFPGGKIEFPRQELFCEPEPKYELNCRC